VKGRGGAGGLHFPDVEGKRDWHKIEGKERFRGKGREVTSVMKRCLRGDLEVRGLMINVGEDAAERKKRRGANFLRTGGETQVGANREEGFRQGTLL